MEAVADRGGVMIVDASTTAVIVVDMWDRFPCVTFAKLVDKLALRMNPALERFREHGIPILFMGEDVLSPYKETPHYLALTKHVGLVEKWPAIPHPQAPGRDIWWHPPCLCEEPCGKTGTGWSRLHQDLVIRPNDLIGGWAMHSGLAKAHGITTLVYCGVTANICVLDTRNFSICQSLSGGLHCILLEDLTETYIPGTPREDALVQTFEYYNEYICPTVKSTNIIINGEGSWHESSTVQ